MGIQEALNHLRLAEQNIAILADKELQRKQQGISEYVFAYEQTYNDAPGWGPNYQWIFAYDIEEAFRTFGHSIQSLGLTVRNIRYGKANEMQSEIDAVREYFRAQREAKRARP
jgi:hypothetical protein